MLRGRVGRAETSGDGLADAGIRELSIRVSVIPDPAMAGGRRPTLTLTYDDGRQEHYESRAQRGSPGRPATSEQVEAKFLELCTPVMGAERADAIRSLVLDLDVLTDLTPLFRLLARDS